MALHFLATFTTITPNLIVLKQKTEYRMHVNTFENSSESVILWL